MRIIRSILFTVIAVLFAAACQAASLTGVFQWRSSNIETFDPSTFGPGPNIDVYDVLIHNPNDAHVTSLEIVFSSPSGKLLNFAQGGLTFKADSSLPALGLNIVAESFFVVDNELAVNPVDDENQLSASYTISGGGVLVPAGSDGTLVAVVSVPAGSPIYGQDICLTGRAAIGGAFETITSGCLFPEPSTLLLALVASAGVLQRR